MEQLRPLLMPVPEGADPEQMQRINSALGSGELQNGMQWLVEQDIVDESLAADYRIHFKDDILGACYGIEPRFHDHVLDHCEKYYRRLMLSDAYAFLDGGEGSL